MLYELMVLTAWMLLFPPLEGKKHCQLFLSSGLEIAVGEKRLKTSRFRECFFKNTTKWVSKTARRVRVWPLKWAI